MSSSSPIVEPKRILVFGATGNQGGACVKALAAINKKLIDEGSSLKYLILAVSRKPPSAAPKWLIALESHGVRPIQGDQDKMKELFDGFKEDEPIYGVFSMQTSAFVNKGGVENEVVQAKALADEAARKGVKHFIYTSADFGAPGEEFDEERIRPVPHFHSKLIAERHLLKVCSENPSMEFTILRPVFFMDNLFVKGASIFGYLLSKELKPEEKLQAVACTDIGLVAALAFENLEEFKGRKVGMAGDEKTWKELQQVFDEARKPIPSSWLAGRLAWFFGSKELPPMFKFYNEGGFGVKIDELNQELTLRGQPRMTTWAEFVRSASID